MKDRFSNMITHFNIVSLHSMILVQAPDQEEQAVWFQRVLSAYVEICINSSSTVPKMAVFV